MQKSFPKRKNILLCNTKNVSVNPPHLLLSLPTCQNKRKTKKERRNERNRKMGCKGKRVPRKRKSRRLWSKEKGVNHSTLRYWIKRLTSFRMEAKLNLRKERSAVRGYADNKTVKNYISFANVDM